MFNLARRAIQIRRAHFVGLTGGEVARAYAAIELGYLQRKYLTRRSKSWKALLGYRFNFLTYESLRYLFDEIFLGQDYCFVPDTPSPFIIDCGSNIGASILYFKKLYPHARIIGFEPFRQAFDVLQSNVNENKLQDVAVYNLGLSGRCDEQEFYYDPANVGRLRMSFVEGRITGASTLVKTTTLSQYIDQTVDFLKMDIEGSELSVMEELSEAGKLSFIKEMKIEYHHHISQTSDNLSQMLRLLERNGFGYQMRGSFGSPPSRGKFQDILIYAYRKSVSGASLARVAHA